MRGYYRLGLVAILEGWVDFENDLIQATLVRIDRYSVDLAMDGVIADVPPAARLQTVPMTGIRVEKGRVFAGGTRFDEFGEAGETMKAELVFWKDTGDERTSNLLAYMGKSGEVFSFGHYGLATPDFPIHVEGGGGAVEIIWGAEPWLEIPAFD